jgi:CRP/FNR family cyclic AMP-dependent transcriptional regulator
VLAIERAGVSIPELPVFDGGPFPASAMTVAQSEIVFLAHKDFRSACVENPELALKVLRVFGARLRRLVGIIEELSFTSLRHRLLSWLLRQARAAGLWRGGGLCLILESHIGRSHPDRHSSRVVSRNMARLQAQRLIESNGHETTIPDVRALEAELDIAS